MRRFRSIILLYQSCVVAIDTDIELFYFIIGGHILSAFRSRNIWILSMRSLL